MDLWALGVCLYAMVTGNIPYETDQIYNKNFSKLCVKNEGNYQFNGAQVSEELIDLIHSLLKVNPKERLGYWNMDDLKSHSFFSKFDWQMYSRKEMNSPIASIIQFEPTSMPEIKVLGKDKSDRKISTDRQTACDDVPYWNSLALGDI